MLARRTHLFIVGKNGAVLEGEELVAAGLCNGGASGASGAWGWGGRRPPTLNIVPPKVECQRQLGLSESEGVGAIGYLQVQVVVAEDAD